MVRLYETLFPKEDNFKKDISRVYWNDTYEVICLTYSVQSIFNISGRIQYEGNEKNNIKDVSK